MDVRTLSTPTEQDPLVVDNWPMNLETTRQALQKAQERLERYQAVLRLANVEIERRNRSIITLATFVYQASLAASPADLLKLVLVKALEATNAPVGAIVLIDAETRELTLGVHKGLTPELTDILTGRQLGAGATSLMPHLVTGDGALLELHTADDETEQLLLTTGHLTSLVSLPLQLGPKLMGALLVGLQDKRAFKPVELHFLMVMSQETAIMLEGLRLREGLWYTAETLLGEKVVGTDLGTVEQTNLDVEVSTPFDLPAVTPPIQPAEDDLEQLLAAMMQAEDEMQQQNADLQTLNTITEMMNHTLDLNQILQCAVDQTQATLKTDAVWLYLIDERNLLEMQAHTGLSIDYVRGMQHLKPGDGIEGRVVAQNKAHFVASVSNDTYKHKIWVDKEQLHALAAVPITRPEFRPNTHTGRGADGQKERGGQTDSHVIGVLSTGKRTTKSSPWNPREVRLLTSIANQVALAVDNARLYAQVQEGETGLRVGNEVLRSINDMLLEKNAYLEGFIQDDLIPALAKTTQGLQHLLTEKPSPLTEKQKQNVVSLQEVLNRLSELAKETGEVSAALDTEFDKVLDDEVKQNGYAGSTKPVRLEKKEHDVSPVSAEEEGASRPKPVSAGADGNDKAKPMSFEEAIAAGLVPAHIMNRETDPLKADD